ncbi:hypothetical protein BGZ76_006699 [Entomortierella beljakovae]|nr:hypothetical protein BGZ76_006699 [Entomortierella beljakovae]
MTQIFDVLENDSKELRIFLDENNLEEAQRIKEMEYKEITMNMGTEQLHLLDSFELSRRSGPLTDSALFRPITIFTYANHCEGKGAGFGAGLILNRIGQSVINQGEDGVLKATDVKLSMKYCKKCSKTSPIINNIFQLFHDDTQIKIIGNHDLNPQLEKLAEGMTSKISKLNSTKKKEIMKLFGI